MDITTAVAVVIPAGTVIAAIASVRQRFLDHVDRDDERFDEVTDMLKEIRSDIKSLLKDVT